MGLGWWKWTTSAGRRRMARAIPGLNDAPATARRVPTRVTGTPSTTSDTVSREALETTTSTSASPESRSRPARKPRWLSIPPGCGG